MNTSSFFFRSALSIFALSPYILSFHPEISDSSSTIIKFAAGIGSYAEVTRDCSGNVMSVEHVPINDGGVSIDHSFAPFRVGAKVGYLTETRNETSYSGVNGSARYARKEVTRTSYYVNPNVGIHWKYFGIDAGVLAFNEDGVRALSHGKVLPQGSLRIGNRNSWYWSLGIFDNLPLATGGGLVDMGLGFNLDSRNSTLWVGVGAGVFDGGVFSVKGDYALNSKWMLNVRALAGSNSEMAGSMGASYRF